MSIEASSGEKAYRVTLVGPAGKRKKTSVISLRRLAGSEWRRLVIEVKVGSERWPTWDDANLCLTAMQDLLKMSDGLLSDDVVNALKAHVDVVTYETFRGPA